MQHKWFNNVDENNFNTNISYLKAHLATDGNRTSDWVICFSHVPKTAGTSLENILAKNFAMSETLHINAPDLNRKPDLINCKKNHPKLICGHHPLHGLLYQLLPAQPIFHVTQLRNPLDRVVSYYNYVSGKQDHPMHDAAKGKNIIEFLDTASSPELHNGQARRFSGYLHCDPIGDDQLYKLAATALKQSFSLVLTTCLFDQGLLLLKKRLGLQDIYYRRSNVSKPFITINQLSSETIEMIESMNQADIKLFKSAKKACQHLIDQELSSNELNQFYINNIKWNELTQS